MSNSDHEKLLNCQTLCPYKKQFSLLILDLYRIYTHTHELKKSFIIFIN